jgi:hypothetical protein
MTMDLKYGVPSISIHTDKFEPVTKSVARVSGTPTFRQVYVPQPVMGKSNAELRAYVDGNDPVTGRPVMQEVVEGLTKVLAEDSKGITFERSTPRLVDPATESELHELFLDNNWTDKLPIVLPTEERVAEMLKQDRKSVV